MTSETASKNAANKSEYDCGYEVVEAHWLDAPRLHDGGWASGELDGQRYAATFLLWEPHARAIMKGSVVIVRSILLSRGEAFRNVCNVKTPIRVLRLVPFSNFIVSTGLE